MKAGLLITDHGAHPPETWAVASAQALLEWFKVDPYSPRGATLEIQKMRITASVADVLMAHHAVVQRIERAKLANGEHARVVADLDAQEHTDIDKAVADVFQLVEPLLERSQLFAPGHVIDTKEKLYEGVKGVIRERIEVDIRTNMHIERSWHADRNQGNEFAQAFKTAFHG
jgi:hypothetical protein